MSQRRKNLNENSPRRQKNTFTLCARCRRPIPVMVPNCRCGAKNPKSPLYTNQKKPYGLLIFFFILISGLLYGYLAPKTSFSQIKHKVQTLYETLFPKEQIRKNPNHTKRRNYFKNQPHSRTFSSSSILQVKKAYQRYRIFFLKAAYQKWSSQDLIYKASQLIYVDSYRDISSYEKYLTSSHLTQRLLAIYCLALLGKETVEWDKKRILQLLARRIQEVDPEVYPQEGMAILHSLALLRASELGKAALKLRWKAGPLRDFWYASQNYYEQIPKKNLTQGEGGTPKWKKYLPLEKQVEEKAIHAIYLWERGKQYQAFTLLEQRALSFTNDYTKRKVYPILGQAFLVMKNYFQGEKYLREALKLGNTDSKIYFYLGWAQFARSAKASYPLKKYLIQKAYEYFYKAIQQDPNLMEAYYYLGRILLRYKVYSNYTWMNQRKMALTWLFRYLAFSSFPQQKEWVQRQIIYWLNYFHKLERKNKKAK